jgi:hypothetical protein
MRLHRLAGPLEYIRGGGVIGRKVSFARNNVVQRRQRRDLLCLIETPAGLAEVVGGLGRHRSIPSRRKSCMKAVRSR